MTPVKLEWVNTGTALVTMQDAQNILSAEMIKALQNTFAEIKNNEHVKAIILTGLETNFCSGSEYHTADKQIHRLLLNCDRPIIAAMHGDALGDGLIFGAFADIIILAHESYYSTAFLEQNFSTELGGTYIIPKKFGPLLGGELIYSSKKYRGQELQERNAPLRIEKKENVIPMALDVAKNINDKLTPSLQLLKKHFSSIIEQEMSQ